MIKALSYNKGSHFIHVSFDSVIFVRMKDLYQGDPDATYEVTGLFINEKSKFGPRPYLATPDFFVDLPGHMLETIREMIADPEVVSEITSGKVGFQIRSYMSKNYNRECYSIVFVEI